MDYFITRVRNSGNALNWPSTNSLNVSSGMMLIGVVSVFRVVIQQTGEIKTATRHQRRRQNDDDGLCAGLFQIVG
jgi:hypothetical protein